MKKTFVTYTFLLLVTIGFAQDCIPYKNLDLEFSALFPNEPILTSQKVPIDAETSITMHMAMLDFSGEKDALNAVYAISHAEYVKEDFMDSTEESNSVVLDGAVDGARKNVNGQLIYSNPITFNGYPARNAKIEISGAYIYLKCYLVENIIYFCQVICLTKNDKNSDIDKFLNSFELIKSKH